MTGILLIMFCLAVFLAVFNYAAKKNRRSNLVDPSLSEESWLVRSFRQARINSYELNLLKNKAKSLGIEFYTSVDDQMNYWYNFKVKGNRDYCKDCMEEFGEFSNNIDK